MNRAGIYVLECLLAAPAAMLPAPGAGTAKSSAPLVMTAAIPLPGVKGRIDHFALDAAGNRLFVSALGNNTEEVISLGAQTVAHTITGIAAPQGVVYVPETNRLFVGSDEGKLYIYDGTSFALTGSIDFGDDVDNLRYDAAEKRVYVGYGGAKTGAIAMVDAATNRRMEQEFKLGAHPESFQLAANGPDIYVNLPELKQIAVVNRKTGETKRWKIGFESNFPMALDEGGHRLFVATRGPARLAVYDTETGRMVAALPAVQDSDDLYYDARRRIYVAGGGGQINVFQQKDADHYELLANVPTAVGARTAGYFGRGRKGFDRMYVAVPARAERGAEILIYTLGE